MSDRPRLEPGAPPALPPLPVEELPDVSWQRIERKLFARLAAAPASGGLAPSGARGVRRRLYLAAGLATAAAAVALVAALALRGGDDAEEVGRPPAPGRSPSRVATADAPSAVSVGDVSLEIAPHSALLVDDDRDRGLLFVLERGEVTFRVAPVGDRPPVVVQAGDVRVEVVGTAFAVSRQGDSARVVVYEGVVSLVRGGARARLAAGSVWPQPAAPTPPPALDQPPRAPARRVKPPPAEHRPDAPVAAPPLGDKDRYQRAQSLERADPEQARAIYRDLVRRGGVWAPMALYAHALLEERTGHRDAARKLLQQYLARYPDGLNAVDARELLNDSASN